MLAFIFICNFKSKNILFPLLNPVIDLRMKWQLVHHLGRIIINAKILTF